MKTRNSEHCVRYLHSTRYIVLSRREARVGFIRPLKLPVLGVLRCFRMLAVGYRRFGPSFKGHVFQENHLRPTDPRRCNVVLCFFKKNILYVCPDFAVKFIGHTLSMSARRNVLIRDLQTMFNTKFMGIFINCAPNFLDISSKC